MSGTTITKEEIERGLKALGVRPDMDLMVHSSLSSLGQVSGGADAVIDALLDLIGPNGTLLIPTHPARDGRKFDPDAIPSDMGIISETFRMRLEVQRSRHPYHPVAATGAGAERMLRDHESSSVPDGSGTPYGRLVSEGGFVLLIGCDLDTLTLLHTVEASLDLPYLRELEMRYVDADGEVQVLEITKCPGGHRGGVLKFNRLFRAEGAMEVGRIGNAVCRLIDAPRAAAIMAREMSRDPCFALDENPNCEDCVRFRERVAACGGRAVVGHPPAKDLKDILTEEFELTVPVVPPAADLQSQLEAVSGAGLSRVELPIRLLGAGEIRASGLAVAVARATWEELQAIPDWNDRMAEAKCGYLHITPPERSADGEWFIAAMPDVLEACTAPGITVLVANTSNGIAQTSHQLARLIEAMDSDSVRASYDPAVVAREGGSPFYGELYKGPLRRHLGHVDFLDVVGFSGEQVVPGCGNSEVVEILSNLRCRSYSGLVCLWPLPAEKGGLGAALEGFQRIMGRI